MIELLKDTVTVMMVLSTALTIIGLIPSLRLHQVKVYHFICGELWFVTAIAYGYLVAREASSFTVFGIVLCFLAGSITSAYATFKATKRAESFANPSHQSH